MGAIKGYVHVTLRAAIALTLVVAGAIGMFPLIYALYDQRFGSLSVVIGFAVNAVQTGIGKPGEDFPRLGAARFYVDHTHWQAKVRDIVRVARLVVWVTGTTEGLKWELGHLRQSLPPDRLILWAHPHVLGLSGQAKQEEWARFLNTVGSILPVP